MSDDIRKGDKVAHRENGKRGVVLEVLDEGTYWQDDPRTATPYTAWVVVRWRRQERPEVVRITDLTKQQPS